VAGIVGRSTAEGLAASVGQALQYRGDEVTRVVKLGCGRLRPARWSEDSTMAPSITTSRWFKVQTGGNAKGGRVWNCCAVVGFDVRTIYPSCDDIGCIDTSNSSLKANEQISRSFEDQVCELRHKNQKKGRDV
jgi:hypothetical protein